MKLLYTTNDSALLTASCIEAKNTLEYTLLLPAIEPIKASPDKWIEYAVAQCHSACHPRLFYPDNYNFFGDFISRNKDCAQFYDVHQAKKIMSNPDSPLYFFKSDFFANTILMQCVMSAYDTIMRVLLRENIKPYTLVNKVKILGQNELIDSGLLRNDFTCVPHHSHDTTGASSKASAFTKKLRSHAEIWNDSKLKEIFPDTGNDLPILYSDLLHRLIETDSREFKNYLNLYTTNNSTSSKNNMDAWNTYVKFNDELTKELPQNNVDRLYYLYRIENLFALDLANAIIQNIYQLKSFDKLYPDGISNYKTLALLCKLPNVFSRNLYLQFALEAVWNEASLKNSFFNRLQSPETMMYKKEEKTFDMYEWHIYLEKFCRFFSNLIFPAYEWYFLLILFQTVEEYKPNTKVIDKLILLQKELANFINQHHAIIKDPLTNEDSLDEKKNKTLSLLSNYDNGKIITPVYCRTSDNKLTTIFQNPTKDIRSLPNVGTLLSILNPIDSFTELPLPNFNRNFCLSSNADELNYNRFIGQFISLVAK